MPSGGEQIPLFTAAEVGGTYRVRSHPAPAIISPSALQAWKQRIFQFQQQVQIFGEPQQSSLFAAAPTVADISDRINPFTLPQQNIQFWRWKVDDAGVAAYYFVIDYELPLVLYIGETVKSNQRWKGEHDCKRYVQNYVEAHRRHNLPTAVNIGFHCWAPEQTRDRQQLETALIDKWRSPFNKQNWAFWGTPFVSQK